MAIGEELKVKVSAATSEFNASMSRVEDKLEEVADQTNSTSRAFLGLSASAGGLTASLGTVSTVATASLIPALGALSTALVPLAATFTVLTGGAVALAGAFGAIVGSGLIAFGEQRGAQNAERLQQINKQIAAAETRVEQIDAEIDSLEELREANDGLTSSQRQQLQSLIAEREETERTIDKKEELAKKVEKTTGVMGGLKDIFAEVRREITPLIVDFGQQFIPLVKDAINALPDLVRNIISAIGPLDEFKSALRDFGQTAMQAIPAVVSAMFDLAQIALPVLQDFVNFLLDNGNSAFESLISTTREVSDELLAFSNALISILPNLLSFGTMVLETVVPPLSRFVSLLGDAMGFIQNTAIPRLQRLAQTLLQTFGPGLNIILDSLNRLANALGNTGQQAEQTAPTLAKLGNVFNNVVAPAIANTVGRVTNAVRAFNNLDRQTQTYIASVVGLVASLKVITTVLAPIISSATTLVTVFGTLSTPVLAVVAALGALGVAYQQNLGGFRESVNSLLPSIEELQSIGVEAFTALSDSIESTLEFWSPVTTELETLGETLQSTAGVMQSAFTPSLTSLTRAFRDARRPIQQFSRVVRSTLRGFVQFLNTFVVPAVQFAFVQVLAPIVNRVTAVFARQLGPVIREVSQTIAVLANRARIVGGVFQTVWQTIDGVVTPIVSGLADVISLWLGTALAQIAESMKLILNLIQGDFGAALSNLGTIVQNSLDFAFDLAGIIDDGITAAITWVQQDGAQTLAELGGIIITAITNFDFAGALQTAFAAAIDGLTTVGSTILQALQSLGGTIVNILVRTLSTAGGFLADAIDNLIEWVQNGGVAELAADIGSAIGSAVKAAVIDALQTINPINYIGGPTLGGGDAEPGDPSGLPGGVPGINTGGFIEEGGLANVHAGERVVPAAQVSDRGPMDMNSNVTVENTVVVDVDDRQLREIMAAEAETVVENKERRSKRNTGGSQRI